MNLLDRYLLAVRFWLPSKGQDEVIRELSEDLHSQMEAREAELGRPLRDEELEEILKRAGNPIWMAGQYLPPRPWLLPVLSRVFSFLTRIILLRVALPLFVFIAVPLAMISGHPLQQLGQATLGFLQSILFTLGWVALIFLLLDAWVQRRGDAAPAMLVKSTAWSPRRLPKPRAEPEGSGLARLSSLIGLAYSAVFTLWWAGMIFKGFPGSYHPQEGLPWTQGTFWPGFHREWFVPGLALGLAGGAVALLLLLKPTWVRLQAGYRALAQALVALVLFQTLRAHQGELEAASGLVQGMREGVRDPRIAGLIMDLQVARAFRIIAIICLILFFVNIFNGFRRSSPVSF